MTGWLTTKAAAVAGSIGVGLLGVASLWRPNMPVPLAPVKVQFAYPVTSVDPTLYDDWESIFLGNHIYPRLLPEDDNPAVPALGRDITLSCSEPAAPEVGSKCRRLRLTFTPKTFTDCAGHSYGATDIRGEFERLLAAKSWALPEWKRCAGPPGAVCVTGKNTGDIMRRLRDVNFRFGWSKRSRQDRIHGAGPYCMRAVQSADGNIRSGLLVPRETGFTLPRIAFAVGGKDADFDVSLYGSKELLKDSRKNVQTDTPQAYYVVTNPSLAGRRLPWNSKATRTIIRNHFLRRGVFFPQSSEIEKVVPHGRALDARAGLPAPRAAEFVLPDYLPGCRELASSLTSAWKGRNGTRATCVDIVSYIQGKVRERRGRWYGFLVGLSPDDPGRDAIKLQYFSKDSRDSLTYDYSNPESLFYLAGIGQSLVTVDGRRVCDLKPNVLGLGNIFITDLVGCDK